MGASPAVFIALSRSALTLFAAGHHVLASVRPTYSALAHGGGTRDRSLCAASGVLPRGLLPSRQLRDVEHGGDDAEGAGAAGAANLVALAGNPASRFGVLRPLEGLVQSKVCRGCGMQGICGGDPYMFRSLGRLPHT